MSHFIVQPILSPVVTVNLQLLKSSLDPFEELVRFLSVVVWDMSCSSMDEE
jgi:hypothetical protein